MKYWPRGADWISPQLMPRNWLSDSSSDGKKMAEPPCSTKLLRISDFSGSGSLAFQMTSEDLDKIEVLTWCGAMISALWWLKPGGRLLSPGIGWMNRLLIR